MMRRAALCAVLAAACSGRGAGPADADAGDGSGGASGPLGGLFQGGRGGDVVELGDGGRVLDELDAGEPEIDAGDAGDAQAPELDAGDLVELVGVADGGVVRQYGDPSAPFNAGAGCAPGYLNCDGERDNGCELELGCPAANSARCRMCVNGQNACVCSGAPGVGGCLNFCP